MISAREGTTISDLVPSAVDRLRTTAELLRLVDEGFLITEESPAALVTPVAAPEVAL
jgi:hypothetical protein